MSKSKCVPFFLFLQMYAINFYSIKPVNWEIDNVKQKQPWLHFFVQPKIFQQLNLSLFQRNLVSIELSSIIKDWRWISIHLLPWHLLILLQHNQLSIGRLQQFDHWSSRHYSFFHLYFWKVKWTLRVDLHLQMTRKHYEMRIWIK